MNLNDYMDYLESEMYDEYDDIYESYEDDYDDYYESELYDEYDKIQVLREAVEDQFINDEIDYEEYEMLNDRLDEREMYLEANRAEKYLHQKYDNEMDQMTSAIGVRRNKMEDSENKRTITDTLRLPEARRAMGNVNRYAPTGRDRASKSDLMHDMINMPAEEKRKRREQQLMYNRVFKDAPRDNELMVLPHDRLPAVSNRSKESMVLPHDRLPAVSNRSKESMVLPRESNNVSVGRKTTSSGSRPNKNGSSSTGGSTAQPTTGSTAQPTTTLMATTKAVAEKEATKMKKEHKIILAAIGSATAIGVGAGIMALRARNKNVDKMCEDLERIQDRLTDLGTERTEVLNEVMKVDKALAKAKDLVTMKTLNKESKAHKQHLAKLDREIKTLTRKAETIGAKIDRLKNK